jgi:hypothetical protein
MHFPCIKLSTRQRSVERFSSLETLFLPRATLDDLRNKHESFARLNVVFGVLNAAAVKSHQLHLCLLMQTRNRFCAQRFLQTIFLGARCWLSVHHHYESLVSSTDSTEKPLSGIRPGHTRNFDSYAEIPPRTGHSLITVFEAF